VEQGQADASNTLAQLPSSTTILWEHHTPSVRLSARQFVATKSMDFKVMIQGIGNLIQHLYRQHRYKHAQTNVLQLVALRFSVLKQAEIVTSTPPWKILSSYTTKPMTPTCVARRRQRAAQMAFGILLWGAELWRQLKGARVAARVKVKPISIASPTAVAIARLRPLLQA
jgi:hypothetical protein